MTKENIMSIFVRFLAIIFMRCIFVRILFIIFLTFIHLNLISQVKISIKVKNIDDNVFYLLKYKSDKSHIVIDTSTSSSDYKTFTNDVNYDEGIYILSDNNLNPLFEILLGKDQKFSMHVEELMEPNSYKVKSCKETSAYFDIFSKTTHNKLYIKALESEMEYFPDNARKIDSIKRELHEYQESMLRKDKSSFLNTYIKFIEESTISNYFDNLPLCDTRILNSRLLKNKLDVYFNNYMANQNADVVCKNIDELILKTNDCHEVRDYTLWYLYSRYFNNDLIYIHLSDNYFSRLEINNLTQNIRNEIIKRADILRNITIGSIPPIFSYTDENGEQINLSDIDSKNTILFFYKPDCQKCIRDKRILGMLKKKISDLTILEINISEDNYNNVSHDIIEKYDVMTTPTIYLLNENKEIIAKHIKSEEVEFHINKR